MNKKGLDDAFHIQAITDILREKGQGISIRSITWLFRKKYNLMAINETDVIRVVTRHSTLFELRNGGVFFSNLFIFPLSEQETLH